jgi:hypothetical protein
MICELKYGNERSLLRKAFLLTVYPASAASFITQPQHQGHVTLYAYSIFYTRTVPWNGPDASEAEAAMATVTYLNHLTLQTFFRYWK